MTGRDPLISGFADITYSKPKDDAEEAPESVVRQLSDAERWMANTKVKPCRRRSKRVSVH